MLFCKSAPGPGFQVFFEFCSSAAISECDRGFDSPGPKLRSVNHIAGIVLSQAFSKVLSKATIKMALLGFALKYVNVENSIRSLLDRLAEPKLAALLKPQRNRPAFVLCTPARQPSLSAALPAKAGGR